MSSRYPLLVFISGVMIIFIVACNQSAEPTTPISTNGAFEVSAQIATTTPTPTPIPTLNVPLPVPLVGNIPLQINSADIALRNGNYMLHITRAYNVERITGEAPDNGKRFLVMQAYLYNWSASDQSFFDGDFFLSWDGMNGLFPDTELMRRHRDQINTSEQVFDYPGRFLPVVQHLIVGALNRRRIVLVYEIPDDLFSVRFNFRKGNEEQMDLLIIPREDREEFIYKARVNGEAQYEIISTRFGNPTEVSAPLVSEEIYDRNCGTSSVRIDYTVRHRRLDREELTVSDEFNSSFSGNLGIGVPLSVGVPSVPLLFAQLILKYDSQRRIASEYNTFSEEEVESERTYRDYELLPGHVLIQSETQVEVVTPFIVDVRVESEIIQIQYNVPGTRRITEFRDEIATCDAEATESP